MSCNGADHLPTLRLLAGSGGLVKKSAITSSYKMNRPLAAIRIRASAGNRQRGWLAMDGRMIPVALGRGGILANKREGDGGTPRGTFQPRRLWWRADRHARPRTVLPVR